MGGGGAAEVGGNREAIEILGGGRRRLGRARRWKEGGVSSGGARVLTTLGLFAAPPLSLSALSPGIQWTLLSFEQKNFTLGVTITKLITHNYTVSRKNRKTNSLKLINSSLKIVYCSTLLSNHNVIRLFRHLEF